MTPTCGAARISGTLPTIPPRADGERSMQNTRLRASSDRRSFMAAFAPSTWRDQMAWKTPKIVEVPVGMEINMYACAARK
jgi:coenzyme PQQ precursor peptide PqqA